LETKRIKISNITITEPESFELARSEIASKDENTMEMLQSYKKHGLNPDVNIASAREIGKLPPIDVLVQPNNRFKLLDGHHRLVIAKHLGQKTILANVKDSPFDFERIK